MTETQIVWIKQLKKGNELAAFNLYNSYAKAMYSTLTRMTNDNDVAKDLLQEAFVKAFRKIGDLEDPMAFAGWLKRIVINMGLEYLRKKKVYFEDITEQQDLESEEVDEKLVDNKTLHNAIKELPEGCRTVLCLHLLEGYKHKEIAEQLGISESTSKTQFRHAKQLLKTKLQHHYEY
ncbi:RNA polymerase, sigma-24 subunit, RpoE [Ekhidna lutea]|uniref:RNA polymerase, sigma-24 subunit, RpoE n=1 Tax=Ekhidna lutea TaxID=447679 RepID=A0A239LNB3_EKHLU|nr:sigma-70 family RNA polymerase sigma factor [Ekhidna lutea]SNT31368.1 RNA polymerase, sigma-24 subunit, RpoE [Ekhidna lutea]